MTHWYSLQRCLQAFDPPLPTAPWVWCLMLLQAEGKRQVLPPFLLLWGGLLLRSLSLQQHQAPGTLQQHQAPWTDMGCRIVTLQLGMLGLLSPSVA